MGSTIASPSSHQAWKRSIQVVDDPKLFLVSVLEPNKMM